MVYGKYKEGKILKANFYDRYNKNSERIRNGNGINIKEFNKNNI